MSVENFNLIIPESTDDGVTEKKMTKDEAWAELIKPSISPEAYLGERIYLNIEGLEGPSFESGKTLVSFTNSIGSNLTDFGVWNMNGIVVNIPNEIAEQSFSFIDTESYKSGVRNAYDNYKNYIDVELGKIGMKINDIPEETKIDLEIDATSRRNESEFGGDPNNGEVEDPLFNFHYDQVGLYPKKEKQA